ncbi:hypothetical protein D3C76_1390590 [compost metagenome]
MQLLQHLPDMREIHNQLIMALDIELPVLGDIALHILQAGILPHLVHQCAAKIADNILPGINPGCFSLQCMQEAGNNQFVGIQYGSVQVKQDCLKHARPPEPVCLGLQQVELHRPLSGPRAPLLRFWRKR